MKYWTKQGNLNSIVTMAMLGTIVFIFGIFANVVMAIPILFNQANRQKHLHFFLVAFSNILFLGICIPLLMEHSSENNTGDYQCNGWLPFMVIFFTTKSILDVTTYSIDSYCDLLFRSDELKTAVIVFRVTSLSVTFVIPLILSCLYVWIDTYRVGVVLVIVYVVSFVVSFLFIFYMQRTVAKRRHRSDSETNIEQMDNRDEPLIPKLVMVSISAILLGQLLVNLMIRDDKYLNEQLIFSIVVNSYTSLTFPMLVSWEKRILQKFYYKNCLNHRVIVPI